MRSLRYIPCLFVALFAIIGMVACGGEDCPINNTVQGKMVFHNQYGDAIAFKEALTVSVVRPQGDSVILNQKTNVSEVLFPLGYTHKMDTIILSYGGGVYDSLYIEHTNEPILVSVECGIAMYHTITSVVSTNHWIDTLILKSPEVDYDERENIQVIYHLAN